MKRDAILIPPIHSSFLSCDKDTEIILRKLFVESNPYSNILKRLLVVNARDCLDMSETRYDKVIADYNVKKLHEEQYIRTNPKLLLDEHADIKSYILISFDNFTTNYENEEFRDCIVNFDVICHTDYWDLEGFKERPLAICGYIDGILNRQRLSGVGEFIFVSGHELILSPELAGYTLSYRAVHFTEDDKKFSEMSSK